MRLPVEAIMPLAALTLLVGCAGSPAGLERTQQAAMSGPEADYPMVLGPSFAVDGVTYTPADRMNYDAVGRVALSPTGGTAISAAHRTLPLPSYVEVTALDSGKTALVRIERRGPMQGASLIELSPGAAAELGLAANAPVRVRRMNPIEGDRAALRSGRAAPARMDTPASLLTVLKRKLAQQEGREAQTVAPTPALAAGPHAAPEKPANAAAKPATSAQPVPAKQQTAASGNLFVQIGAFASKGNADAVSRKAGGAAVRAGNLWRVRTGPYPDDNAARAALAKVRAAGYTDARIQHGT